MGAPVMSPASYAFSAHALLTLLTALAIVALGVLVFVRERASTVSRAFLAFALVVGEWLFAFCLLAAATRHDVALWWVRAAYLGIPAIGPMLYSFTVVELGLYQRRHTLLWLSWLLAAVFTAATWWTDALVAGLQLYWWGYYPRYGWLGAPFIAFVVLLLLGSMAHHLGAYRAAPPGVDRRRLRGLIGAFAVGYVAVVDFVPVYGVPLYPVGYLAVLGFVVLAARAIWRDRLVEITPAFAARQIIETMADALFVLDRAGLVRLTNRAACALLDRPEEELLGRPLAALFAAELPLAPFVAARQHETLRDVELAYAPRGGDRRTLILSVTTMRDAAGQPVAAVCIARDITAQKRAEAEIRRLNEDLERRVVERTAALERANRELVTEVAERKRVEAARADLLARERQRTARLARLADALPGISSALSPEALAPVIVQQAREIIGAHRAVIRLAAPQQQGQAITAESCSEQLVASAGNPPHLNQSVASPSDEQPPGEPGGMAPVSREAPPAWAATRHPAGIDTALPRDAWLVVPLVADAAGNLGYLYLSHPDQGRFTAEDEAIARQLARVAAVELENAQLYREARDAVRARETLLSIVSHDLRNLLSVIAPSVELLERIVARADIPQAERMKAALVRIGAATRRVNSLINELLDFARLQVGQPLDLQCRPTDLVALARRLAAEHQGATDRHRIGVETALPALVGLWDDQRLERVLANLLSNGIKYSPDGGAIVVEVAADGPCAVLTVRDQGLGIPAGELPHIFEWFHRASNVSGQIGGTGIGLASVRQIVEQHGGTVAAVSQEGRGSAFTVRLPISSPMDRGLSDPESQPG